MAEIAIIGGTGLTSLKTLDVTHREVARTPYGEPSAPLVYGNLAGKEVVFLARHGYAHTIPPHKVNYRANLWALAESGVREIIAVGAVGGIRDYTPPGGLGFPDQIIDYTWGRAHTLSEGNHSHVTHVDLTYPYCESLRQQLTAAANEADLAFFTRATYGATQGPRLETAAEVQKLARDGCDIIGMTGMPEAALARELGVNYATCAVVANWAAGITGGAIDMSEIEGHLRTGMAKLRTLLEYAIPRL